VSTVVIHVERFEKKEAGLHGQECELSEWVRTTQRPRVLPGLRKHTHDTCILSIGNKIITQCLYVRECRVVIKTDELSTDGEITTISTPWIWWF